LGCILYELCTLKHPFDAKTQGGLFLKIIKGTYEPISSEYSRDLSDLIAKILQKDCRDRPSIQQILETPAVIDNAIDLGLIIPTDDEVKHTIILQKTDFMTTFAKKKQGPSQGNGSGSVGLVSRDKLQNKQTTGASNIKNTPPVSKFSRPPMANKHKLNSKSALVDVDDIVDNTLEVVDKISGGSIGKKNPSISKKYVDKKKAPARGIYGQKPVPSSASKAKPSEVSKKNKEASDSSNSKIKPQRPASGYLPQRNYNKPWQRPKTAVDREPANPKMNKKKSDESRLKEEKDPKEQTRKKANDIMTNRKNQIRPMLIKKAQTDVASSEPKSSVEKDKQKMHQHRKSQMSPGVKIDDLEEHPFEVPSNMPLPYPQSKISPAKKIGMKKMNSYEIPKPDPLRIPLSEFDDDFDPRDIKPELEVSKKLLMSDEKKLSPPKKSSNQFKMIADVKKRRKTKVTQSQATNSAHINNSTEITQKNGASDDNMLTSGNVDEAEGITKSYVSNEEEDKVSDYGIGSNSKLSQSSDNIPEEEDTESVVNDNPFNYSDNNFFVDDEDQFKTPYGDFGLDEINEEEELFDECAIEKRHLKERIREVEKQIKEKWDDLKNHNDDEAVKR